MGTTIEDVVALVIGEHPEPPWLAGRLRQMSHMVRSYVEGESTAPKRTEMRARLDAFREAIVRLQEDLSDPQFVTYIGNDWSDLPLAHHEVLNTLACLGNRASSLSMKFAGRAGAERAYPVSRDDSISSHELCIWTIMQAMMRSRKLNTIAAANDEAWAAANAFYRMSGGQPLFGKKQSNGDRGEPSGWREYIISVQHMEKEESCRARGLKSLASMFEAFTLDQVEDDC